MENNITLFEQKYVAQFKKLGELKKAKKELEGIEAAVKEELKTAMDEYDIKSINNDYVSISRVAGSEKTEIDLKKLQEKEPGLYEELLEDYPKTTKKAGYIRIEAK